MWVGFFLGFLPLLHHNPCLLNLCYSSFFIFLCLCNGSYQNHRQPSTSQRQLQSLVPLGLWRVARWVLNSNLPKGLEGSCRWPKRLQTRRLRQKAWCLHLCAPLRTRGARLCGRSVEQRGGLLLFLPNSVQTHRTVFAFFWVRERTPDVNVTTRTHDSWHS